MKRQFPVMGQVYLTPGFKLVQDELVGLEAALDAALGGGLLRIETKRRRFETSQELESFQTPQRASFSMYWMPTFKINATRKAGVLDE
jgi:hypothetical protein